MDQLKVLGDDLFDDPTEDDLLTDSEAEEASRSLQRLLDDNSARPIPIPSHKRSPVVKYHEEGRFIFENYFTRIPESGIRKQNRIKELLPVFF